MSNRWISLMGMRVYSGAFADYSTSVGNDVTDAAGGSSTAGRPTEECRAVSRAPGQMSTVLTFRVLRGLAMGELPTETVHEVESLVTDWLEDNDVPGVSLVVVDGDSELYAEGFGARDIESNAPATPDTVYGMASITKSITALAVLQLIEAGALSVDDYVDHFQETPGDPITIENLLTHTSGMPATPTGVADQALEGFPAGLADESDHKRFVRDSTDLRVTDEERFQYYNTGYDILGKIIEAVDGRSYADYVDEEIFEPLGMTRATFDPDVFDTEEDAMTAYHAGDEDHPPEPTPFPSQQFVSDIRWPERPSAGLIASVRDVSRFLRAMMTDGRVGGTPVCTPDSVDRLQEGRVVAVTDGDGREMEAGYGWTRRPLGTDVVGGVSGSILVATSYAGRLQEAGVGVVVASNMSATPPAAAVGQAVLALVDGQDITAVPGYALNAKCEAVAGTYEGFREKFTISVEPVGGLSVTFESSIGGEEIRAFPATLDPDDHEFDTVTGGGTRVPVEFDLDGDRADLYYQRFRARRTIPGT